MNKCDVILIALLLFAIDMSSQRFSIEAEVYTGVNQIVHSSNEDLVGGLLYGMRVKPTYWMNSHSGVSTGIDISDSYVVGLRDYSVLLGCDNRNGSADSLSSYFMYGVERVDMRIPVNYILRYGRIEIETGLNLGINLKNEIRSHLVECGECGDKLEYVGDWDTWDVRPLNLEFSLGMSIGLLDKHRLRIYPRINYQIFQEKGSSGLSFRELLLKLGVVYRLHHSSS